MRRRFHRPSWTRVWPDLIAFAIGLGIAYGFHWKTADLVWSLWLGSLTLGYLTILSAIAAGVYIGLKIIFHAEFPRQLRLVALLAGSAFALFMLGFFSFHFCAFHAGHAEFLKSFFPLKGLQDNVFGDCFLNPFRLWSAALRYVAPLYGAFLIPAIIAERANVFSALADAWRAVHEDERKSHWLDWFSSTPARRTALKEPFLRPYLNVIRMHFLIFFFAFCHAFHIESFLVFAVVYAFYFFPWSAVLQEVPDGPA